MMIKNDIKFSSLTTVNTYTPYYLRVNLDPCLHTVIVHVKKYLLSRPGLRLKYKWSPIESTATSNLSANNK